MNWNLTSFRLHFPCINASDFECEWHFSFSGHIAKHSNPFEKPVYILTDIRTAICCHTIVIHVVLFVFFFPFSSFHSIVHTHKLIACFVQLSWFQVIVLRDKTCIQFWSLNTKPLLIYIRAVCVGFVPPDDDGKKMFENLRAKRG